MRKKTWEGFSFSLSDDPRILEDPRVQQLITQGIPTARDLKAIMEGLKKIEKELKEKFK